MKRIALTIGLVCFATSAATAAQIEFRGGFCITSANAACTAGGWDVGCQGTIRYSPRNLGDNGASTRLSLFTTYSGQNYTLDKGNLVNSKFLTVNGTGIGRGGFQFTTQMRLSSQSPTKLTDTTPSVTVQGSIQDFDDIAGCDIDFKAAGINTQ